METLSKNKWKLFFGIQILILLVGTFADFQLSQMVYSDDNAFGIIFEILGELPLSMMATAAALYKGLSYFEKKKVSSILHFVLSGLFAMMSAFQIPHYLKTTSLLISGIVFVLMLGSMLFVVSKFERNDETLIKYASLVIFVAFMNVFVINVIKQFWGRERYRHMVAENNFDGFSKWFIPQGIASGDEFKSFPSGHSANASIVMLIALFPFKKTEKVNKVFVCVAIYTMLVQFSRIIQGAHFLSDVTMGVIIGLLMIVLGNKLFTKFKLD